MGNRLQQKQHASGLCGVVRRIASRKTGLACLGGLAVCVGASWLGGSALVGGLGAAPQEAQAQARAEWEVLFDGSSTDNLRGYKQDGFPSDKWTVEGNELKQAPGGGGDLISKDKYLDFELRLDWNISEGGNSGIFILVQETDGPPWYTGPEFQVFDTPREAGKKPGKHDAGSLYDLIPAPSYANKPAGQWNHSVIRLYNGVLTHTLNGKKMCTVDMKSEEWQALVKASKFGDMPGFGKLEAGHIGLQDHGDAVRYRNIRIRRLSN